MRLFILFSIQQIFFDSSVKHSQLFVQENCSFISSTLITFEFHFLMHTIFKKCVIRFPSWTLDKDKSTYAKKLFTISFSFLNCYVIIAYRTQNTFYIGLTNEQQNDVNEIIVTYH